jgi:hypothetical protein
MSVPESTLEIIHQRIEDVIAPIIGEGDYDIREIQIGTFSTAEEMGALFERYKSRFPGAYLSPPTVAIARGPALGGTIPTLDATLGYSLLVGMADRDDTRARLFRAYRTAERIVGALNLIRLPQAGVPSTSIVRESRPSLVAFAESEEIVAALVQFDIQVRNWQVSGPTP